MSYVVQHIVFRSGRFVANSHRPMRLDRLVESRRHRAVLIGYNQWRRNRGGGVQAVQ